MSLAAERHALHDERLEIDDSSFVPLPYMSSVSRGIFQGRSVRAAVRQVEARCDVVLVQLPFAAAGALLFPQTPRVYHACANILELVRGVGHYRGVKRVPAVALATAIDALQRRLIARSDSGLIANGAELYERYGRKGACVVSATLLDAEVGSEKRMRPPGSPFRLLYVGYLRAEKGVGTLLSACERLMVQRSGQIELHIVGASDTGDRGVTDDLRDGVARLRNLGPIVLRGPLSFGPKLFQALADADALVLPSLSEGTPRILVEARAFGCPVIASNVGGVPSSVTHDVDGLLFRPGDVGELVASIESLMDDRGLRERLIAQGYVRARASTVQRFVATMANELTRVARQP